MIMRKVVLLAVAMAMALAACGPKLPATTPKGARVAYEAGRVQEAIQDVQKLVADLEAQHVLTTAQAGTVMIAAYKAGGAGVQLADLAQAYDVATGAEAATLAPRIEALLHTIETAFPKIDFGPNAAKVGQLIQGVVDAVTKARAAVGELRTLTHPPAPSAA